MADVIGVIQARMGSTRLPGKLLMPLARRPLLEVLVERIRPSRVDEWWIATTDGAEDDITEAWAHALGMRVLRGDRDDVLSRFVSIAGERRASWMLRLTADNPFVDAGILNLLLASDRASHVDLVAEETPRGLPLGYVPELVRASALVDAARGDLDAHHRAHVTSALRERGVAPLEVPGGWPRRPAWRWTIDTPEDLAMADAAFQAFGEAWATIDYPAMVGVLDAHPEIVERNAAVRQKGVAEG